MVSEIRIYIEGDKALKEGFDRFFGRLIEVAGERRIRWKVILCGPRLVAYKSFKRALDDHPDALNLLLVDAEGPVMHASCWAHLQYRDGDHWIKPPGAGEHQCHLMVQAMEAWFIADIEALRAFYGQYLKENALPATDNGRVEHIPKDKLEPSLIAATREPKKKRYHKTNHAPVLLMRIRESVVRKASLHCDRLFQVLEESIEG